MLTYLVKQKKDFYIKNEMFPVPTVLLSESCLVFTSHASLQKTSYNPMSVTFPSHVVIVPKKRENVFSFHQQESGLVAWQHLLLFTCAVQS